ncbi:MAG: Ig-like domain-containing protein [Ignavibacteria bacterium]|nr:Ig-like domain-containing protein [Ignavibacteria bacterium]
MKKIIVLLFIAAAIYSNEVIYVDPVNGAKMINPENNITVGFKSPVNFTESDINNSIIVSGSISGIHNGSVKILENGKKFIFKPEVLFTAGENISVKFTGVMSKMNNSSSKIKNYSFSISKQKLFIDPMKTLEKETGINFQQYQVPLSPPVLNVTVNNNPAPGKLFFAPFESIAYNTI